VLASRGCTDDGGPDADTCAPLREPVCVPQALCSCSEPDTDCTRTAILGGVVPRVICDVPARRIASGLDRCSDMVSDELDLSTWVAGAECEQPVIGSLQLRDVDTSHDFGGALVGLSSPSSACKMEVTWKDGTRTVLDLVDHGFIKVPFAERALLLPLLVKFVPGCTTQFDCRVEALSDDTLWSCAL
jgi:hypothetical protein